ncbi:helix-hairpin-helix domain-containing protein [Halorubrum salipaludis]|nr:helix-hairpin-helix domain-containing protein [Halorubrum salipaludis]
MSTNDTIELEKIPGIGPKRAKALRVAGYETLDDLEAATEDDLRDVAMFDDILARDIKATVSPDDERVAVKQPNAVTPDDWRVTKRQLTHIRTLADDAPLELDAETALDLRDRLEFAVDPDLLDFRRVCGRVVTYDADTDEYHPVPNATVHVEDTDCSFLSQFPSDLGLGWFYPYDCTRETIATTTTDECGEFCVYVPTWDIDRVLSFREERLCLPEIAKPRLRDVLERPEVFPDPVRPPDLRPRPRPDPLPDRLFDPGVLERTTELLGDAAVRRLGAGTEGGSFGDPRPDLGIDLDRPAFPDPPEPPTPEGFRRPEPDERVELLGEELPVDREVLGAIDPDRFVGPFLACTDVTLPEWRTIVDVPDITFRVTQDVDGDGTEETIYSEGYFDVRWDEAGSVDVDLVADDEANSIPTCDGLTPENVECDGPSIDSVGLMPTRAPIYDDETGYARRINRPKPSGSTSSRPDGTAPFSGTLQLHGCHRFEEAEYYRVLYSYEGGPEQPFTGHEWHAPAIGRDPVHVQPTGSDGWYPILDIPYLESYYGESLGDNPLLFPYWLLNWNTRGYRNGTYEVRLQLGDANGDPLSTASARYAIEVDNRAPNLDISRLAWGKLSDPVEKWDNDITESCPQIRRPAGENIGIKVTFRAWGEHFRSVQAKMNGCNRNPTLYRPSSGGSSQYSYWHETVGDRNHRKTVAFEVPSGYQQGAYRLRLRAVSRAFNPAGGNSGPSTNWEYDNGRIDTWFTRSISITNQ